MKHSFTKFVGMFPRYQPFVIPDMAAQILVDGNIVSGGLEAFREDVREKLLDKKYRDFYKYYRSLDRYQWLVFDTDIDIVRSSIINDVNNQMYITGLDTFRTFDSSTLLTKDITINSTNSYVSNIPLPESITLSGATTPMGSTAETRVYGIAYARHWKSGQIDLGQIQTITSPTFLDCNSTDIIKLSKIFRPTNMQETGVTHVYLYRSAVTTAGTADYRYLDSFSIVQGELLPASVSYNSTTKEYIYTDTTKTEDLGEHAVNLDWTGAPDNLTGIIALRNGVLAGYVDNTVYISVPYQGHAWPYTFVTPVDYNIVGIGSFGNTLVVCTNGTTYLLVLNDPSAALLIPIHDAFPCTSKESIVSLDNGCIYACKSGLVRITGNGAELITKQFISDKEWIRLQPHTIKAAKYQDKYLMFWDSDNYPMHGFVIDFNEPTTGLLGISQKVHALYADPTNSTVYIMYTLNIDGSTYINAFAESRSLRKTYKWMSKKFLNNEGLFTLSAGKVNFYSDDLVIKNEPFIYTPSSHAFNVRPVNTFAINGDANTPNKVRKDYGEQWCIFSLYVDDTVKITLNVYDNTPFRLPAGFRGDSFYIELTSTVPIARVQVADSIGELE